MTSGRPTTTHSLIRPLLLGSLWLAAGCTLNARGCLEPPIVDEAERQGIVSGTIVYDGPVPPPVEGAPSSGNTLVFLYAEANPPPPEGGGRPVTFAVIARSALFPDGAPAMGLHTASFSIPLVPPGRYTVRALLDADGNFQPFALVRASATRGDVGGALIDTTTTPPAFPAITVEGGKETRGVTVTLSDAQARFLADAPAFSFDGAATMSRSALMPVRLRVRAFGASADGEAAHRNGLAGASLPGIAVAFGDVDGDGLADDRDGDGFADVYPRFVLRKLSGDDLSGLTDEAPGATIPCVVDPTPLLGAWPPPPDIVAAGMFVEALDVLCLPVAVDAERAPLAEIPAGEFAMIAISAQGQVWRVPNELGPRADPVGRGLADVAFETQGQRVVVTADELPAGRVAGNVFVDGEPAGPTYVFAFLDAALPPPAGEGRPVAAVRVAPADYVVEGTGWRASYTVSRLPAGAYRLLALLDQDGNFDSRVEQLSQPGRGDLVSSLSDVLPVGTDVISEDLRLDTVVPVDPPRAAVPPTELVLGDAVVELRLDAAAVDNALARTDVAGARFPAHWRSARGDGDGDGLQDLWPRVLLERVLPDPLDVTAPGVDRRVVIPAAVDPAPMALALADKPILVERLHALIPPLAVDATNAAQPVPLGRVPGGTYAVTILSSSGQFWRRPSVDGDVRPSEYVTFEEPFPLVTTRPQGITLRVPYTPPPSGAVEGLVRAMGTAPVGPVWVFAFDEATPGPPDGSGLPSAATRVMPTAFEMVDSGDWVAPYRLSRVASGSYVIQAISDEDANFSLLSPLRSFPSRGDRAGAHEAVVVGTQTVTNVNVVLAVTVPFEVPAFVVDSHGLQEPLESSVHLTLERLISPSAAIGPDAVVDVNAEGVRFAVSLRDADGNLLPDDADGDGLPDLYPRVVLQRLDDDGTPSLIPAVLDPARYLPALLSGTAAVVEDSLHTVVLPVALENGAPTSPRQGTYGIALATLAGQTWRVPNALASDVATAGGGIVSQGETLAVTAATRGTGRISGDVYVVGSACGDVVVVARDASGGAEQSMIAPEGLTIARASRDDSGACLEAPARYTIEGMAAGAYLVQAFLDVDGDFNPFWLTRKGPGAGDVVGGHVGLDGVLVPVAIDEADIDDAAIVVGQTVPIERPAFRFEDAAERSSRVGGAPVRTALVVAGALDNPLARIDPAKNAFTTNVTGGATVVTWPLVLFARLDEEDPRGLRVAMPLELMAGVVDNTQFSGPVAGRIELDVAAVRVDSSLRPLRAASPGRYAVVVVNEGGQSWQIPNELDPALSVSGVGFAGSDGQGASWTVLPP